MICSSRDIQLLDEVSNGWELLEKIRAHRYDVAIIDLSLPEGPDGLEVLSALLREGTSPAVLVLSVHPEEQTAVRALQTGAAGYIVKDSDPQDLLEAIRRVAGGGRYVSRSLAERLAAEMNGTREKPAHEKLTNREFMVLGLLARGHAPSAVARKLHVSSSTVATYRSRILRKLRLRNNAELVRYALDRGLLD